VELHLTPDLETKLARLAEQHGRSPETLALEAVQQFVSYEGWFAQEVDKGLAAADHGEFVEHEEVLKVIERRYSG